MVSQACSYLSSRALRFLRFRQRQLQFQLHPRPQKILWILPPLLLHDCEASTKPSRPCSSTRQTLPRRSTRSPLLQSRTRRRYRKKSSTFFFLFLLPLTSSKQRASVFFWGGEEGNPPPLKKKNGSLSTARYVVAGRKRRMRPPN